MGDHGGPPNGADTFFDRLDTATVQQLRRLGRQWDFATQQVLTRQGEPGDAVLIIDSGVVKVSVSSAEGDEVLLGLYGRGELLGEVSALTGACRSATVTGHLPGVATEIEAGRFRDFLEGRPDLLAAVLTPAAQRLRRADLHRLSYAGTDVGGRVASTLLEWANRHGTVADEGVVIAIRASRRELAQAVAASEKTVDDVLTLLTRARLVSTGRRRFVVLDMAGLHRWLHDRSVTGG